MKIIKIRKSDQTFDSFVSESFERCSENKQHRDNHIRCQKDFITDYVEIFRLEDGLEIPLREACKKLKIKFAGLQTMNTGSDVKIKSSKATLAMIKDFYSEDFISFNYDPDLIPSKLDIIQ